MADLQRQRSSAKRMWPRPIEPNASSDIEEEISVCAAMAIGGHGSIKQLFYHGEFIYSSNWIHLFLAA